MISSQMTLTGPREHGRTKIHRTQVTEVLLLLPEPYKKDQVAKPSTDTQGSNRSRCLTGLPIASCSLGPPCLRWFTSGAVHPDPRIRSSEHVRSLLNLTPEVGFKSLRGRLT